MTPEFKFRVESVSIDGVSLASRFLNATSAYSWAKRLQDQGIKWTAFKKVQSGSELTVSLAELKKESGPCRTKPGKRRK